MEKDNAVFQHWTHVEDDAGAPVVQTPIVALVPQYFGGEIGGRSHNRFSKAFFTNDPREAKVAQFYLEVKRSHLSGCKGEASSKLKYLFVQQH